jgi:hypothetical protein
VSFSCCQCTDEGQLIVRNGSVEWYKGSQHFPESAFCAFSIGIRGRMGKNMAYLEISLTLTYLLWHYDIRLKNGDKTGEEGPEKTFGDRLGEYQLNDCFVAKNNGPIVEFRAR